MLLAALEFIDCGDELLNTRMAKFAHALEDILPFLELPKRPTQIEQELWRDTLPVQCQRIGINAMVIHMFKAKALEPLEDRSIVLIPLGWTYWGLEARLGLTWDTQDQYLATIKAVCYKTDCFHLAVEINLIFTSYGIRTP